jgi:hypothetical protein
VKTERIDGIDYVVGTAEHSRAKRAHQRRLDDAYLHAVKPRFDGLVRLLTLLLPRLDANGVAFLARDLVFVRREIIETVYGNLLAASLVPVDTEVPRGAQSAAQRTMRHRGEAKVSHTLAGDHPRVDVDIDEVLAKFANITASYGYDLQELEYAGFAGVQLSRLKADACAETVARGLNGVGMVGDAKLGLTGLLNNALVNVLTLTNGAWLSASADNIVADLAQMEQAFITQNLDVIPPEGVTLLLPTAYEGRIATLQRSSGSDLSVKEWFLRNARIIKSIERVVDLDSATGTSVRAADPPQGILYVKSPRVLRWPVPVLYEEEAPQQKGFEFVVPARARASGVEFIRPTHALYIENLD